MHDQTWTYQANEKLLGYKLLGMYNTLSTHFSWTALRLHLSKGDTNRLIINDLEDRDSDLELYSPQNSKEQLSSVLVDIFIRVFLGVWDYKT